MSLSIEELSQPISEDAPSGENLEYDPQYMEMENLFETKSESSIQGFGEGGDGPDWKGVAKLADGLSKRTRDLRVEVYAAIASIHTEGLCEFRDHLKVLKTYLDDFWDSVHPQLDPDDDNDPTLRLNTVQMLNEYSLIAMALDRVKLVELKGMGQFGVREVDVAQGRETPDEGEEVIDLSVIREAFAQAEPDHLDELHIAVAESQELLAEMDGVWQNRAGDPSGLNFDTAVKALKNAGQVLSEFGPAPDSAEAEGGNQGSGEAGDAVDAPSMSGVVNSRADVIRTLDKICEYYTAHEPSSPIPLLLRRAQGMVEKSFMEILEDMVPDGLPQAKIVSGVSDE